MYFLAKIKLFFFYLKGPFKGSVQQKLSWAYINANRWVLAWDCGT
jgi:hypothetical protein